MDCCNLGKTNISVPIMGVGTMLWLPKDNLTEEDLFQTYQACLEHGMDFFDTAEIYGNGTSESLIGKFQQRDGRKIKIATKFAPPSTMNPLSQKRKNVSNDSPEALLEALEGSLERLQTNCIDLYQMHTPPKNGKISDYMDVMAEAVRSGKVRAVGVCNFSKDQIQIAHDTLAKYDIPLATAMTGYNILRRYPETNGVFEICRKYGITVIPYAPLAEGTLTGKYRSGSPKVPMMYAVTSYFGHLDLTKERNDNISLVKRIFSKPREIDIKRMEPVMNVMEQIANTHGKTIAQVALNWLISTEDVHVLPIPGTKSVKQAHDNSGAADWKLTPEERHLICTAEEATR